ncbi:MAG: hypothetical protein IPM47_00015 [Sphingobacteriales bacterium]|nr:MAG: hypothetical protein IPM47_00015 [Sphingobacteriales bacterium]
MIDALRLLASNIEDTGGNDAAKLADTGFYIYGVRKVCSDTGNIENLRLSYGKISGTVVVR